MTLKGTCLLHSSSLHSMLIVHEALQSLGKGVNLSACLRAPDAILKACCISLGPKSA